MSVRLAILVGVGVLAAFPPSEIVQATPYYVTGLGTLGGPTYAFGVNNSGQVVGVSFTTSDTTGDSQAFLWDRVNGMTSLFGPGYAARPTPLTAAAKLPEACGPISVKEDNNTPMCTTRPRRRSRPSTGAEQTARQ